MLGFRMLLFLDLTLALSLVRKEGYVLSTRQNFFSSGTDILVYEC